MHGYGGIGKTSLAVEYAWRQLERYPGGAFFLSCDTDLDVLLLHELASHLGIQSLESTEETAQSVRARLETGESSLLILDNVQGPRQWSAEGWKRWLPGGGCRVLVTTRSDRLGSVEMYRLDRLSSEDGRELLRRYRADVEADREVVGEVVEWFDGLAVGLTVVGIYMDRGRVAA